MSSDVMKAMADIADKTAQIKLLHAEITALALDNGIPMPVINLEEVKVLPPWEEYEGEWQDSNDYWYESDES